MKAGTNTKQNGMSVEQVKAATTELGALRQKMTFVLPLTAAERRDHAAAKIGPKKLRAIENRLVAAQQHRELLPPVFDLRKFERDAALTIALGECQAAIDEIRGSVHDTLLAVGNRAALAASTAYAHIQVAAHTAEHLKRTVEKMAAWSSRPAGNPQGPVVVTMPLEQPLIVTPVDPAINSTNKAAS